MGRPRAPDAAPDFGPCKRLDYEVELGFVIGPGNPLGSGTISGTGPGAAGSLIELTQGGKSPLALPTGETRTFIADGDEVIQRGRCEADGAVAIGFGEATGIVRPAR